MYSNKIRKVNGICFRVQSSVKSPEYIWGKINEFVIKGKTTLTEMTDEIFQEHLDSVLTDILQKDQNLTEEADTNFYEIRNKDFNFGYREKYAEIMKLVKKEFVLKFYCEHLINNFKRLNVEVVSKNFEKENEELLLVNQEYAEKNNFNRRKVSYVKELKIIVPLYKDFIFNN